MVEDLIILAEDDKCHRFIFERAFIKAAPDHRLLSFTDGFFLMEYLLDENNPLPKVIFLDINMPRMSGLECLKEIRENKRLAHIPVIMHSTSRSLADERMALLYRASLYLHKTGEPEELRYIINKVINMEWIENLLQPSNHE